MKRLLLLSLLLAVCLPANCEDKPAPAPAVKQLSADQKVQLREYQLRNSNAVAQISQLQLEIQNLRNAQAENNKRMQEQVQDLLRQACGSPDKCTLDFETLAVKAIPPSLPAAAPAPGK